ncbi:unnamed protein product [Parascedosporium putredinis]|uniref:Uncharacterized protein n=1 Tax=Parascedosporium putredinis TaxID=1442378 RepID=A0A9P1H141_9PEZI|nr:unnamed protein product [Parascedosporium putredinis]CAI7992373.1 unnamed protein product [Parascedosporium putredinis]
MVWLESVRGSISHDESPAGLEPTVDDSELGLAGTTPRDPLVSITASPNHVPSLEFCTIDASATKVTIGDDELVGLPDANDYSRQKQVYKVFLLNYCSGTREAGSQDTDMDYCSETGEEIWDLLDPWIVWGVKLKSDGSASFGWLDRGPDWLWIAYIAGGIFGSLSVISALVPVHRLSFAKWPVVIVASLTAIVQLSIAIAAQITFGTLVASADDEGVSITAKLGVTAFMINWIAALSAVVAAATRVVRVREIKKDNIRTKHDVGLREFLAGTGSHKYTEVEGMSLQNQHVDVDNPRTTLGNFQHDVTHQESKYEPYRPAQT